METVKKYIDATTIILAILSMVFGVASASYKTRVTEALEKESVAAISLAIMNGKMAGMNARQSTLVSICPQGSGDTIKCDKSMFDEIDRLEKDIQALQGEILEQESKIGPAGNMVINLKGSCWSSIEYFHYVFAGMTTITAAYAAYARREKRLRK